LNKQTSASTAVSILLITMMSFLSAPFPTRAQIPELIGEAYLYTRSGSTWTSRTRIIASDAEPGDNFGPIVASDGERVLIGAPGKNDPEVASGAAYVFEIEDLLRMSAGDWNLYE